MQTAYTKLISKSFDSVMTLATAKEHLSLLDTNKDSVVTACKNAAIAWAETRTERVITESVYEIRIEPDDVTIVLPLPDFIKITKLETVTAGVKTVVYNEAGPVGNLSDYITVDDFPNPAEITVTTDNIADDVDYLIITASFGMGASVPEDISQAIKLLLGHFFQNPNEVVTGTIATQVPMGAEVILAMNAFKRYG